MHERSLFLSLSLSLSSPTPLFSAFQIIMMAIIFLNRKMVVIGELEKIKFSTKRISRLLNLEACLSKSQEPRALMVQGVLCSPLSTFPITDSYLTKRRLLLLSHPLSTMVVFEMLTLT